MPPVVTCDKTSCKNEWNVGSDDFVVPALIAIVVGFFNLSLILAVIFAIYYVPGVTVGFPSPSLSPSLSPNSTCANVTSYSPLLYAPLFSLAVAEISFILNEVLILCLSAQGPVIKETKSFRFRVRYMPPLIYVRIVLAVFELFSIVASIVGLYHPLAVSSLEECEPLDIRLKFARVVVFLQAFFYLLFLIKVCIYTDPLGCSTPGLLERLSLLDKNDARESVLLSSSSEFSEEAAQRRKMLREVSVDELSTTREVAVWTKRNKLFSLNKDDISKVSQIHNDSISRKKIERKLRAIFCCLGVRGQKSRGVALEDVARGLYTVFSEMNIVLSDVIAGFSLLKEHQKLIREEEGGDLALTQKFRMVSP